MDSDNMINKLSSDIVSALGQDQKIRISNSIFDGILKEHQQQLAQIDASFNDLISKIPIDKLMAIVGGQLNRISEYRVKQDFEEYIILTESYLLAAINYVEQIGIEHHIDKKLINHNYAQIKSFQAKLNESGQYSLKILKKYRDPDIEPDIEEKRSAATKTEECNEGIKESTMQLITFVSQLKGTYHRWRQEQTNNFTTKLHQQINGMFGT